MEIVIEVDELVAKMKSNVREMVNKMEGWAKNPMFQRKPRPSAPEDVESIHSAAFTQTIGDIAAEGRDI